MKLRIVPLILSAVVMAAHFLRSNSLLQVLLCLALPFLLLIKKRWSLRVVQTLTVLFALLWLGALNEIIQVRILESRSWTASAIILGVVAVFSLFSGWLLNSPKVKDNYPG
ncbi:MAG: hypothetical protein NT121_00550 [Chloroflexi bacterium]|jgi:hypothetical protein|nr:hypothetical protein [Chloroflexota bacterium]